MIRILENVSNSPKPFKYSKPIEKLENHLKLFKFSITIEKLEYYSNARKSFKYSKFILYSKSLKYSKIIEIHENRANNRKSSKNVEIL